MKRAFQLTACAFLLLLPYAAGEVFTGKVVGITDGDTILVMHNGAAERVRFHGVDAPEASQDFGSRAKDYVGEQCHEKDVTIVITDRDRYGRTVGLVVLGDGRVLNHELVAAGLAWWYREYAPHDLTLEKLEQTAKATKQRLWGQGTPIAPWDFRRGVGGPPVPTEFDGQSLPPSGETIPARPSTAAGRGGNAVATPQGRPGSQAGQEVTVYATRTGTKYHRDGCGYLSSSKIPIALASAKAKYGPCSRCNPQR